MASASKNVWAIDVGSSSLKAVCYRSNGDNIEIVESIIIDHKFVLSAPGVSEEKRQKAVSDSIADLAQRRDLRNEQVVISVPGQTSFARFIKLPPVDKKKIPKMIQFEAQQQIPFDIHEVEWDYQLMNDADSPDASVGIFAIKNDLIASILANYTQNDVRISQVQMAPIALYNFACYEYDDITSSPKKATILLDMGTDNTNLVICSGRNVWQRCIPMGGNSFTQAIASAFKIDFEKAEKLKRGAQASKYAKQIFQAMRPVYTKLSEEIQRSVGFYLSTSNVEFTKVIAIGGGFRLQGVAKFLQQSLGVKIVMPSDFKKATLSDQLNAAKFHESILELAVGYGLGAQALGMGMIDTNLLPRKLARSMIWKQKAGYFNIAAAMLLIVGVLAFGRALKDKMAFAANEQSRMEVQRVLSTAQQVQSELSEQKSKEDPLKAEIEKYFDYFENRDVVVSFIEGIVKCLPDEEKNPEQAELYQAFKTGDVKSITEIPRDERKQIFITSVSVNYTTSVANSQFGKTMERSRRQSPAGGMDMMGEMGMPGMDMGMPGMEMGMPGGMDPWGGMDDMGFGRVDESEATADGAGFLVVLEGYIPYERFGDLMDPPGVADDKSQWGFITYLENFADVYTKNKLSLYEKDSSNHFVYEYGLVDLDNASKMPAGIGKQITVTRVGEEQAQGATRNITRRSSDRITKEEVLIDPMTGEEMSKTFKIDDNGVKQFDSYGDEIVINRDHWFRIKAKFLWEDAPSNEE